MKKIIPLALLYLLFAALAYATWDNPFGGPGGGANYQNVVAALGYTPAHNGANSDITSLTGLTTPLSVSQGGTGSGTAAGALSSLGGVASVSNVKTYMGAYENSQSVAANAVTCDWSLGSTCVVATQNAATAWTLTMSNPVAGQTYRIRFVQNATGGASAAPLPTFSPTIRAWQGNQTPALTTTANKVDYASCFYSAVTPTGYDCKISNTY
jgi:hypothetical protein